MSDIKAKLYAAILFLPVLGFFLPHQTINEYAYFLVVVGFITLGYGCYSFHPKNDALNTVRKCLACFSTAALIFFLSA